MTLDVIIRTHDPARLDELNRAVFSAALQEHRPTSIIVVCQRYDSAAIEAVQAALAPVMEIASDVPLQVLNRPDPAPLDARAALLNVGLRAATARYIAFLDYDDLIYPDAWEALTTELEISGAAIAFGGILNATVSRDGLVPYISAKHRVFRGEGLPQLLHNNFCPLHSFVLDRSLIAPQDLIFDETLVALEDYDLLLRIVSRYPSSFHHRDTIVGEYLLKDDHSNLNPIAQSHAGGTAWMKAVAEVDRRKTQLVLSPAVQRQLRIDEPGLTVAEYLARHPVVL
jgi:hypothetical protein